MEAYIFADIGAWTSFEHLEDELTLSELLVLVASCRRSDFKNIKMMAMAQGADTTLDDEDYGFETEMGQEVESGASGFELTHLPVSLGYEVQEAEKKEVIEPTKTGAAEAIKDKVKAIKMGTAELIESKIAESEAHYIRTDDEED